MEVYRYISNFVTFLHGCYVYSVEVIYIIQDHSLTKSSYLSYQDPLISPAGDSRPFCMPSRLGSPHSPEPALARYADVPEVTYGINALAPFQDTKILCMDDLGSLSCRQPWSCHDWQAGGVARLDGCK